MTTPRCGHECNCPSKLHHNVQALLDEYNAPIVRPPYVTFVNRLEQLVIDDRDEEQLGDG